jgi:hypothetical protein
MNTERTTLAGSCQGGATGRQCVAFLVTLFVCTAVLGAIGGVIGVALYGPNPGEWGVVASLGFAVGAGLAPYLTMNLFPSPPRDCGSDAEDA